MSRIGPGASCLCLAALPFLMTAPASAVEPTELVRAAIRLPCLVAPGTDLRSLAERLPLVRPSRNWVRFSPQGIVGRRMVFGVAERDELIVDFTGQIGHPDHVTARYATDHGARPVMEAIANEGCAIHTARRLRYDDAGRPEWLDDLDGALRPTGAPEPLNPPVPDGADPPGIPVGVIDSGVNYLLPEIAQRLARGLRSEILGYDYADLDRRPFDVAATADPFRPDRHGTLTASIVLDGAPVAKLIPYRYPHHAMARMAELVAAAAARGIRVMNLSLASQGRDEWRAFGEAARSFPEMLFVVAAGNHGLDIDRRPVYPAALALDNMVVVTSATADGRLTSGVNWGATMVDLMAPGEAIAALGFDGRRRPVSGSSYATARVSALAACLLAGRPGWSTAELKAAIFERARPDGQGKVAVGFLADSNLIGQGACAPRTIAGR